MSSDKHRRTSQVDPYKFIKPIKDENFDNLLHNWDRFKDEIILFLGAGASIGAINSDGAKFPSAYELRNEIWKEFMLTDEERKNYNFSELGLMSLEQTSTLAEIKSKRSSLSKFISKRFMAKKGLWQHAMLPFLTPHSIFTTNYDNLIEIGFDSLPKDLINKPYCQIFNNSANLSSGFLPLYKPHGSVAFANAKVTEGGIVITQFDYYEMLNDRKAMLDRFIQTFNDKCVIFIGYSFSDTDISTILYSLAKQNRDQSWYAVFPRNDSDVRSMLKEKFCVKQINKTFFNFVQELDNAKDFIPSEWKFSNINKSIFQ